MPKPRDRETPDWAPRLTVHTKVEAERSWPRLLTTESSLTGSGAHQTSG